MIQSIFILIAVLLGWFLRDLRIEKIKEVEKKIKKKLLGDKSGLVDWTPPKSEEELAEEEVKEKLKK